jgi:AbrB family looped-hinge helix DNA binding protein
MVKTRTVRLLRNGQITIPKDVRDELGLRDDALLSLAVTEGGFHVRVVQARPTTGSPWAKQLYDIFAPARKSLEGHSEQEINDAIDEALRAYRAERA